MAQYPVKVDPNLNVETDAFGVRVGDDHIVFIPSKLAQALEHQPLGNDARAIAGYLASFPTSVAGSLGLSPSAVMKAAGDLMQLLKNSGVDVPAAPHRPRFHYGARHPRELDPTEKAL